MHDFCTEYADALVDFSDGELSAEERGLVEQHLVGCPACRAELERLDASLARLVEGVSTEAVSVPGRAAASSRLTWAAAVAATVLLCAGATWWSVQRADHSRLANAVQPPAIEIGTAPKLNSRDALWQIALLEQQARLQTSLELLPKDETFEEQRREDERLLAKFQSMARDVQSGLVQ
jgi:anti-sigma factor RsiW